MLTVAEEKRFITTDEILEDLRLKVAVELRRACNQDPPKLNHFSSHQRKNTNNPRSLPPPRPTKKKRRKKKRVPFDPPSGVKSKIKGPTKELERIHNLLSGWGDPKAIDYSDKDGRTPIIIAAEKGRNDICELLVRKGANLSLAVENIRH